MKKSLFFLILGILLFGSCKKENNESNDAIIGSWIQVGADEDGKDVWDDWSDCEKDDVITFKADGTYELNDDATKCNWNNSQIYETGNWAWSKKDQEIDWDGSYYNVDRLYSKGMTLSFTDAGYFVEFHYERK